MKYKTYNILLIKQQSLSRVPSIHPSVVVKQSKFSFLQSAISLADVSHLLQIPFPNLTCSALIPSVLRFPYFLYPILPNDFHTSLFSLCSSLKLSKLPRTSAFLGPLLALQCLLHLVYLLLRNLPSFDIHITSIVIFDSIVNPSSSLFLEYSQSFFIIPGLT